MSKDHKRLKIEKTTPGRHLLGFEGQLEGEKLQAIDQVHFNKDGRIDQLIIYMRPIPVAQRFAEVIMQRLQPTAI